MNKRKILHFLFSLNVLILILLVVYKIYLNFFEQDFQAVHAEQVERIEAELLTRTSYSFAVVGNINNSIGIFERKIIPMLNRSGIDFMISTGNAVSSGGEDKYRALYRALDRLDKPYVLTFGQKEDTRLGGFRFYNHFGPYVFAFSAGTTRFVFLDGTGTTSFAWQLRWLEEELIAPPDEQYTFVFCGRPARPVDRTGLLGFDDDYILPETFRRPLCRIMEQSGVNAFFSANLPVFSREQHNGTEYILTGGAGGLILNTSRSYYHYVQVKVSGKDVEITPMRLDIGQHPVLRTLESLWFFIHSVFYVGYLNFVLLISFLIFLAVWFHRIVFKEKNYYPNFDLEIEPYLHQRLKIAMFTNNYLPFIGGVPISIDRLQRGLQKKRHHVLVVAPVYPDQDANENPDEIARVPVFIHLGQKNEFPVANIFSLRTIRKIMALRPDVIHLHHPFWMGSLGLFLARRLNIPSVYTYHTRLEYYAHFVPLPGVLFRNLISHSMIRRFANRCDAVVVPTESAEEYLRVLGVKSQIFVQPTGIEFDRFSRIKKDEILALRRRLGIGEGKILLTVSRLSREKNMDFLLEAASRVMQQSPTPVHLVIIGDGAEKTRLQDKARKLGIGAGVWFAGHVSPQDIPLYCGLGDVFVFTSRSETQGMVILEAMAAGLPVVAIRSSGIDDVIRNGFNGYKTRSKQDLWCERVEELLRDEEQRRKLGRNAQKFAQNFSVQRFGEEMTRVYAHVLSARAAKEKKNRLRATEGEPSCRRSSGQD
jgi:glycosyltransferase involved in cell wall biosynthesis